MALFAHLDWNTLGASETPWRQRILNGFRARATHLLHADLTVPTQPGGWMHQFICPTHWEPLLYTATPAKGGYRCPCGHTLSSPEIHAAWLALRHRELADAARDLALAARLFDNAQFAEAAWEILTTYAALYEAFAAGREAQPWMLTGKAFHQALTESLWAVPIVYAFDWVAPMVSEAERAHVRDTLLRPIATTLATAHAQLIEQNRVESNYTAWLNAALGCLGVVLEDEALISRVLDGPGGFYRHINLAVRADGLEYEGSPYYHNFVVLAYVILAEALLSRGVDLYAFTGSKGQSIRAMWDAFAALAAPDGSIPELNDGAYWRGGPFDAEICAVYEMALARTGNPLYAWLLRQTYRRREIERHEWAAVLFADRELTVDERPLRTTTILPESGIAVLRHPQNPHEATLVFGPDGGSHTHHDRLALNLWPWSTDAGTPPYGIPERVEWYQQTLAHNTIMVDGESQTVPPHGGRLWVLNPHALIVAHNGLYEGVRIVRGVSIHANTVEDNVLVSARAPRVIDWIFYTDTHWQVDAVEPLQTASPLAAEGPGRFAIIIAHYADASSFQACTVVGRSAYRLRMHTSAPCEILLVRTPGPAHAPSRQREALIVRYTGRRVRLHATLQQEAPHA